MRTGDALAAASLVAGAAVAAVLGLRGVRHPGLIAATPTGGLTTAVSTAAAAAPPSRADGAHTAQTGGKAAQGGGGRRGSGGATAPSASGLRPTRILLAQSPYAPYAVPVYPRRAAQAAQALDGFVLRVVAAGALRTVEVSIPGAGVVYSQKIDPGDRVYFVEGQMSDDAPGTDVNGGDDGVIITDARGYILQ
ncbi:MAG: hypothetical protein K6V73_11780 [Firmicutes bacterium]|nr:hypothetical protein [Bacillota bacterium]